MRTMSDVPLGAFLSGGIDSSTIVAVLADASSHPVETFCIGFGEEGKAYEERPIAREVSEFFGTNHHEMEIALDLVNSLEPMVGGFDEPFGNPTAMLTYELSRFTRQFVTVSLAGDGGDEVFGGYPRYRGQIFADRLSGLPRFVRSPLKWAIQGKESSTARNWRRWARQLFEGADLPPHQRYVNWVGYATTGEIDGLLSPEMRKRVAESDRLSPVAEYFQKPEEGDSVQRSVYADLHGFLPENVLRYSDRMSMAHSLEIRVPFTDHRLIETIMKVPSRYNVGWTSSKRVLSRVMKGRLPEKVLRRKKLGFNPPMGIWLQKNDNALIAEWLHPDLIRKRGLFREEEVRRLIEEHQSHKRDHGLRLWSLIVFEAWQRMYLD
jgi:asparagine synthase (glutamine-hydrolysing)